MADFFLILSHDSEVGHASCDEAERRLRAWPGGRTCEIERWRGSAWSLVTARNRFVPYSASPDPTGIAIVMGASLDRQGLAPTALRATHPAERIRAAQDACRRLNFGLALSIENGHALVTADFLGLFPVYYHRAPYGVIVTSAPTLVSCHPAFRPTIDTAALAGLLLLAHCNLGHSLFRDVRRLRPGELLVVSADGTVATDTVPPSAVSGGPKDLDEAVEAFDCVLEQAVASAAAWGTQSVLLSGGLDSRLVAGYLHRCSQADLSAVTLGEATDLEMRAAARVASALSGRHQRVSVRQEDYERHAHLELDQDAMTSGLYGFNYWAFADEPHPPVLTGLLGDSLMGTKHVEWARERLCNRYTFNALFNRLNTWGLSPGIVRELVRDPDIDDIVLGVYRKLRDEYYSLPGPLWQKTWWFDLQHRMRFLVGRLAKIIAVQSWPVLPFLAPGMLDIVRAAPLALLADRRAQVQLALCKFPELAHLPFADNVANRWYRLGKHARGKSGRMWSFVRDALSSRPVREILGLSERRAAVRFFDFNGQGWGRLRDQARAAAADADQWLDSQLVLELIPPSQTRVALTQRILEPTGRRAVIGAVLCCAESFSPVAKESTVVSA